ncbi:MAG: phosphodiesterase [Propionibacteriales bacterium]|nr:phosphodiesterase [Propionibacteriales bacterium]
MPESSTASPPTQADELRDAIDRCGYYPTVVAEAVESAIAGEHVADFVIHHEPTFDQEEVRRHVTVLVLTATRLMIAHTDEHPADDLLPSPYASTSTEAIALSQVRSVVTSRMVADPESYAGQTRRPEADEAVLTIGWGAVNRVDLEPATCGDPECTGDHGYTGTMTADDFSIRMSAAADGHDAVRKLLSFANSLSAATAR